MNNLFCVQAREIPLLDEKLFLSRGGAELHFGPIEGDTVRLYASGTPEAIRCLAREIINHHTSAATHSHESPRAFAMSQPSER
jgi:hypothetical protein